MADVLKLVRQGLKVEDEVNSSQLSVFVHKHFNSQQLVEVYDVDEVKVGSYVPFIYEDNREAKSHLER